MAFVVVNGKALDCRVVDEKFSLISEDKTRILRALSKGPKYSAQIARELNLPVQTVYYHVDSLLKNDLIRVVDFEERNGAMAKKYGLTASAFTLAFGDKWVPFASKTSEVPKLFSQFIKSNFFNGKFILGSPDPHGKYRASGSEFCAMELAMFLGAFASFEFPLYLLDTEVKGDKKKGNLILIGGPKVNILVSEFNSKLPIKFDEMTFNVVSSISGKTYGENVGIIQLVPNPLDKQGSVLLIAGSNHFGTRVAILALISKLKEVEKGNLFDKSKIARVVQGFDEDGDGIVDAVEFLE